MHGGEEIQGKDDRRGMSRMFDRVVGLFQNLNNNVNCSTFGRVFRLKGCGHVSPSTPLPLQN
jgi:hypothetical protein